MNDASHLRNHLFSQLTQQTQRDTDTLRDYKTQVQDITTSYQEQKHIDNTQIQQLQHKLEAATMAAEHTVHAAQTDAEELQESVKFYQQSLLAVHHQYEALQQDSTIAIQDVQQIADEKIQQARSNASHVQDKCTTELLDMKTKQRQHRMNLEQDKSVAEKQLRREYYHQAQEMSVQRMRDFYAWKEQSRNTLGVQAKDALLTTPSKPIDPTTPTTFTRMADASTAQDVLFLTTQVTELQAEKDNTQIIQQQLQDEIHVLQDQLVQTAHESYQAKTLHHDNQTHVQINAQLKERINMLEQEATSTHEYKMQAMAKDRTVLSLQNAVKNAKHEAEIQRKKGYEEALKSMEQDIVGLHHQIQHSKETVALQYKGVVDELRQQRDQFERELLAARQSLKEQPTQDRTAQTFQHAIASADSLVDEVQHQAKWYLEKQVLEKKLNDMMQHEQLYHENVRALAKEQVKNEQLSKQLVELAQEKVERGRELQAVNEERALLERTVLDLERRAVGWREGSPAAPPVQEQPPSQPRPQRTKDQEDRMAGVSSNKAVARTEHDLREMEEELIATQHALEQSQRNMQVAKQQISDLTWQTTSMKHDAFMAQTSASLAGKKMAAVARESSALPLSSSSSSGPSFGVSGEKGDGESPTTLQKYALNTKTLTQVLANTKPMRIRLEASTAAHQRSRMLRQHQGYGGDGGHSGHGEPELSKTAPVVKGRRRKMFFTSLHGGGSPGRRRNKSGRVRVAATILTPAQKKREGDLSRSDLTGVKASSVGRSTLGFGDLSSNKLSPMNYYTPPLEGDI
jgi:hypothetical protein